MSKHAETQLERLRYGGQSWSKIMSDNAQKLEDTLLKLQGMLDTQITSLTDEDILVYNYGIEKWENIPYSTFFSTTTTSSTSSTTTTAP